MRVPSESVTGFDALCIAMRRMSASVLEKAWIPYLRGGDVDSRLRNKNVVDRRPQLTFVECDLPNSPQMLQRPTEATPHVTNPPGWILDH